MLRGKAYCYFITTSFSKLKQSIRTFYIVQSNSENWIQETELKHKIIYKEIVLKKKSEVDIVSYYLHTKKEPSH